MDGGNAKTKALEAIEARMREVAPGSYRHQVLTCARDFKNAWIDLGHHLTRVRDGALYKEWGYEDFETYCQRELHLRKATAHKLTATYAFMERHEPSLAEQARTDPAVRAGLPPFEVLQVLSRAEESGQIGEEQYQQVRDRVFTDERPPSPAGLSRVINASWPPPAKPEPAPDARARRLAAVARRLADEASREQRIPQAVRERATALAEDFESLLDDETWRQVG